MFFVYVFEEDFEEFNERSFYTSCEEILIVRGDSNWLGRYYIRNMSIDTVRWLSVNGYSCSSVGKKVGIAIFAKQMYQ